MSAKSGKITNKGRSSAMQESKIKENDFCIIPVWYVLMLYGSVRKNVRRRQQKLTSGDNKLESFGLIELEKEIQEKQLCWYC